ncbi:GumC family protein [Pseudomonas sp. N040]|uniref:GumC family protein n=1 Tax=Pseudomonas sp. N040 TaxID=2785325 RepID=UPI0018A32099|nr:polysaccharide biosynthesis tyrosine autokinase [Pseudomonas sp. N040]MBF7730517.1 polysaccharide biosynthesis tyrosine autokinase [Pseudomonas sp. N040]MBW7014161.1 polysaccharide biosynthesis tyrosine autokinase [Pseudomonas sp. N040]
MESNTQIIERNQLAQRQDDDGDEIDLLKLWHTVWQRKWSIATLVLVVSMIATLWANSLTPIYRAAATLLIEQNTNKVVNFDQGGGYNYNYEYLDTQFQLLRSRSLAERVVRQLNLTTHPYFDPRQQPVEEPPLIDIGALLDKFDFNKVVPATLPVDLEAEKAATEAEIFESVTQSVMGSTTIEPVQNTQLVQVQVELPDAALATAIANALANGFIESQLEASVDSSMAATNWMNSRLGELRIKLKKSEDNLQKYREAENLVDVQGVGTISAAELSTTSDRMIDARRQRAEAESQYRQVQGMQNNWERLASVPAVLGNPLIQSFKTEEARARAKVEELSRRYGAKHPAMLAAQSELSAASASLRSQVEQVVAGIERTYQLAVANENSLQASVNVNKSEIQDISRKEFKLRELQREVDANRALYDTFMNRLKETSATSDLEAANARVVDQAVIPGGPIKPQKSRIVLVATLLAGMLGVGLTLLLEVLSNTFKSTEDVESRLNLPVLGILPLLKNKERGEMARMFNSDTDKSFSESIRTIRTGVVLSGIDHPHQVLVITSSVPGEGKSCVSSNLAFALGHMERVLLIDADLRRPTLAKSFAFPVGTPGLANMIAGTARLDECVKRVDGIDVIGAGTVPPNPLELLSSPRFAKAMEVLKGKYERIVIDSPPTQAVSDAIVLSTFADSLIYVIKSDATHIPMVEKGIGQLLQNNAPIKGIVLNQVDIKKAKKYGYRYGGYYDYYGYSDAKHPDSMVTHPNVKPAKD